LKAITYYKYGAPDVLEVAEVPTPSPKENEVRIRIFATSVSSGDVRLRKADPFLVRLMMGLQRPKINVLGFAFAGEVGSIGSSVTRFKVGDEVYGTSIKTFGAYAEYICLPEDSIIILKPRMLSFEEAAVIPFGGTTALHFLRKAGIQSGQKVLIYGASGAVGTSAVQIAKYFGVEVTAVTSGRNEALVTSLGANKVIDYTREDFSKAGELFDIVFDAVGMSPFEACVQSLKENGSYVRVVHMSLSPVLKGLWVSIRSGKKIIGGTFNETVQDLEFLNNLIEAGQLKPVIDRTYHLDQMQEAHRYVEEGHKRGNVAIRV
jgi:NADPH:quinone reductase-like Zn-dependent oxidoreductase